MAPEYYDFGPYKIHHSSVFYTSDLCFAFVNLRPAVPGHILFDGMLHILGFKLISNCDTDLSGELKPNYGLKYGTAYAMTLQSSTACSKYLHVLICPKREAKRVADLTADEITDMWFIAQKVGRQLESYHNASSLTFCIQDGPQAGQTVPHVHIHIHILPRRGGDYENNDDIYDDVQINEKEELQRKLEVDKERKERSLEEMAQEADEYRKFVI